MCKGERWECVCVCAGRDERLCKEGWVNVCARGRGVCEGGKERGARVCVG